MTEHATSSTSRLCPTGDQMHPTDDPEGGMCSGCVEYNEEMRQEWEQDQLIGMGLNPDGSVPRGRR